MKGKMLLCFAICVVLFTFLHGQHADWLWAKSCGGTSDAEAFMMYDWDTGLFWYDFNYWENGCDIALDSNGNIYTIGYCYGEASFGNITASNLNNSIYLYIAKMDSNGNYLWVKQIRCTDYGIEYGWFSNRHIYDKPRVTVDPYGNVIATGSYGLIHYSETYYTQFGEFSLPGYGSFVCKLDTNGNYAWVKRVCNNVYIDYGHGIRSIVSDQAGNIYLTGGFYGSQAFGAVTLQASGTSDVLCAKLDSDGNFVWANSFGGSGMDCGASVDVDENGNSYITGVFEGLTVFGTNTLLAQGSNDIVYMKINPLGEVIWAKRLGGETWDFALSVRIAPNGDIVLLSKLSSNPTLGNTPIAGGLIKTDANGDILWSRTHNGVALSIDAIGNLYTIQNQSTLIQVSKFDPNGFTVTTGIGGGGNIEASAIATDTNGDCYIIGLCEQKYYEYWLPGFSVYFSNNPIAPFGQTNIIVAKYKASAEIQQKIETPNHSAIPDIIRSLSSSFIDTNYVLRAWFTTRPDEVVSTSTHYSGAIRLHRANTSETRTFLKLGAFDSQWSANETLHYELTNIGEGTTASWEVVIPEGYPASWGLAEPQRVNLWPDQYIFEPIVSISSINGNIQLSWNAVPGASSYRVEKCNDLSEPFVFVESTSQLSFAVSSTEQSAFFRVVSASGDIESVPSAITGYVRYDLVAGYNCIALPLIQDTIFTSELSTLFDNSVSTISIWNHTTQAWTTAVNYGGGFWDPDISLSPGSVLLIYANSPISYYSIGLLPDSHAQYTFVVGDNAVMIPLNKSALSDTALSGISMGDGQAVNTISVWNPAIQGWESTVNFGNGYWDPIYSTNIGTPLFLNSYSIETWPMGPRAEPQSGIKRLMEKK